MKKKCAFVLTAALLLMLTGCSILEEKTETETAVNTFEQFSKPLDNGKPDIYLITKGYDSFYWDTLRKGAADAAEKNDCNLYVAGTPNEACPEYLAELMKDAIDAKADAVIVSPVDVPQIIEASDQVKTAGIPLIFVDTILNGVDFDVCLATDNMQAGRLAAKEMVKLLYQNGRHDTEYLTIGIEISSVQSQTIQERLAGFQEYWCNYAPKSWKVLEDIKINGGDVNLAEQQGYQFMDHSAELAGLVGLNNGSTVGLAKSVLQRQNTGLALVGFDDSDEIRQLIRNDEYSVASIVQRQYDMGYDGVEQALELIAGNVIEYRYVDTGVVQVNHDNIDSMYKQEIIEEK